VQVGGGAAGRVAAGRRAGRSDARPPAKAIAAEGRKAKGKAKKKSTSPMARLGKLVLLLGLMACVGFIGVLVFDAGLSVLGSAKFGTTTGSELWDKLADRFMDRDVPTSARAPVVGAARSRATPPAAAVAPAPARAPVAAPARAQDYVEHVTGTDTRTDDARRRLDALMQRL
jgi:hypothetical protein